MKILTKRDKMELRKQIEEVINHPFMSSIEPCIFSLYGDGVFTYTKESLTDQFYEINFIPLDASTCVLDSETIEQLLSIPFSYLRVVLFNKDGSDPEVLINYAPKITFDFNLN